MKNPITLSGALRTTVALMATLLIVSCQKEINPLDEPGTGTTPENSYLPLTKNSKWQYQDSADAELITTMEVTGNKKSYNNIQFTEVVSTSTDRAPQSLYYAEQSGKYYLLLDLAEVGQSGQVTLTMLDESKSIGEEWSTPVVTLDEGVTQYTRGTIVNKNTTISYDGITYENVLHTKAELIQKVYDMDFTQTSYHFFLVKGIGLVKSSNTVDFMGQTVFENASFLVDYSIK